MPTINAGKTGYIVGTTSNDFTTARSTGGTATANPNFNQNQAIRYTFSSGRGGGDHFITRTYIYFDVSSYTGTISNVVLNVEGYLDTADVRVVPSANAFGGDGSSNIDVTEFFTGLDFNNPYNDSAASWSTGTNNIPLNSDAATDIQNNNAFILALVQADNDFANNAASVDISEKSGIAFGTTITLSFDETISSNNSLTISTGRLTISSGKFTL